MDQLIVCLSQCKDELSILNKDKEEYLSITKKTKDEITSRYEEMRAKLEQNYKDLITELKDLEQDRLKDVETRTVQLDKHITDMNRLIDEHKDDKLNEEVKTKVALLIKWHDHQNRHQLKRIELRFKSSSYLTPAMEENVIGELRYREVDTSARAFTTRSVLDHVEPMDGCVAGLALHASLIYISLINRQYIEVFDTKSFKSLRQMNVKDLLSPEDLVISSSESRLFVSEPSYKNIHRLTFEGQSEKKWSVDGTWSRLSISSSNTLLMAAHYPNYPSKIYECSTVGKFLRSVTLDSSIERPVHVVQLSDIHFVLCHRGQQGSHRVCIVDNGGQIVQSYGGSKGSGVGRLHSPTGLAVDRYDHVFVCDSKNNRVIVLDPSLTYRTDISIYDDIQFNRPISIHYDETTRRLYIGEDSGQRLIVVKPSVK